MSILEIADDLWTGARRIEDTHPFSLSGEAEEVADGVAFVPAFANVSALATDDGLMLVDTGSAPFAQHIHDTLRRWNTTRLNTAVFSHGHIDHVFGVAPFEEEARTNGWAAPRVVAHERMPARFDRYILTAGYNEVINRRQFGLPDLRWPREYRYPDETYADATRLEVGGLELQLTHCKGETDDHTYTWVPERKLLCCGDLFIWASPNAGNPQKVQRYPREWAAGLRTMAGLGAEIMLPGPRRAGDRRGPDPPGAHRQRRPARPPARRDGRDDERRRATGRHRPHRPRPAAPPGPPLPAPGLRRARVRRTQRLAAVRRLVGRRPVAPQAVTRRGRWRPRSHRSQAVPAGSPSGRWRCSRPATTASPATWPSWPPRRRPSDPAIAAVRAQVFSTRASHEASTMSQGVFNWAARESGTE